MSPSSTIDSHSSPVDGRLSGSRGSGPAMAANISAASATVRAIGPSTERPLQPEAFGTRGTRPCDGLKPTTPLQAAGWRIEAARSLPWASGPSPAATAAAAPPDDPPGERSSAQGLRVAPKTRLSVSGLQPNSGVLVLPSRMAPAARIRWTSRPS